MNLKKKKKLIARTLGVGTDRIIIKSPEEVKEAITRQDIKELLASKLIGIKPGKGRKTIEKKNSRRRIGSIRRKIKNKKREYIRMVRKMRGYAKNLKISREKLNSLRTKIKSRDFKSFAQIKNYVKSEGFREENQ